MSPGRHEELRFATRIVHGGAEADAPHGAVVPSIQPSTTFARNADYELVGEFVYARYGSPTGRLVEELAADMEGGADALLFSSGLAAFACLFETVESGSHVVAPQVMYHGGQDWLRRVSRQRGIDLTLFDSTDPDGLSGALRPGETEIVWIESPTNPTWDVIDIGAAAEAAHDAGALLAVDSTVAPPVTCRPIEHGADIVFHSATKYLNGHSDVLAGLVVTAREDERWSDLRIVRKLTGGVCGAFDAWLLLRGLRTLDVRYDRCSSTAMYLAGCLETNPAVVTVLYPGLESHPSHEIARRQMTGGFGGMLSLLIDGSFDDARAMATRTRVFTAATSFGGMESLIEHRASVEGPLSKVPPNLVRLSVGIEHPDDLLADIQQALDSTAGGPGHRTEGG